MVARAARRFSASFVTAGMTPSGGSTMSDVCLNAQCEVVRNEPMSSPASRPARPAHASSECFITEIEVAAEILRAARIPLVTAQTP